MMLYTKDIFITNISQVIPCFNDLVQHEHEVYKNRTCYNQGYPEQIQKGALNNTRRMQNSKSGNSKRIIKIQIKDYL